VDEHILLAIKNLQNLWTGNYPALTTLLQAFKGIKKRWVLFLAVLLHDLGKIYRHGHEFKGVDLAAGILSRIGVAGEDRERVLFLIKNHLIMTTLSQRRELTDLKVIADFSHLVRDRENLALLYLLTFADISAVNPTAWTPWKAGLLQDLYVRTLSYLDKSAHAVEEERARLVAATANIRKAAEKLFSTDEVETFLLAMPDQYLRLTSTNRVIDHIGMMKRLPEEQLEIRHRHYAERGYTELTICAYDAYGMFYRTAGTIAAKNLNILRAQVYTSKTGVMIDTFQITDPDGKLYDYEPAWQSVIAELKKALMNKIKPPEPRLYVSNKVVPGVIAPAVEFDNETSSSFTIVDITARDRVGFLYSVTRALYDLNLDIGSAKIVTEGARVLDAFYVTDLLRNKITDPIRLGTIREALMKVVES
jgi:[protein-PII] uridylyltransferase